VSGKAILLLAEGKAGEARTAAEVPLDAMRLMSPRHQSVKGAFVVALEAALQLGQLDDAEDLLVRIEALRTGELAPFLVAHRSRFRARLAAARGIADGVEQGFKAAAGLFREYGIRFWLAVTLLEYAEWLAGGERDEEAGTLVEEAREIFERLKAEPWLERCDGVAQPVATIVAPTT
jgi:hypothetical protein